MNEKVVLITGASRGIGAATALLAAEKGYDVCVNYLNDQAAASSIVKQINDTGARAFACQADVSKQQDVERMFNEVDSQLGLITALVNNAGVVLKQSLLVDVNEERLLKMFAINFIGSVLCAKYAIKRMSNDNRGQGGVIVNVSSQASKTGSPFEYIDYASSKAAIDTMTIGLAKEVAEKGIRVNAVRPGFIDTDIHASGGEANRLERLRSSIPMKRAGTPQEVAQSIVWLLSAKASYVTGALIDVTGGK